MAQILNKLKWRYATKKFDSTKKIPDDDLNTLLEATRLSASSYGLQPYHVFVVENEEIRAKLRPFSWGQSQITDASHLILFASKTGFNGEMVDRYLENVSHTRKIPADALKGYGDFMKSKLMDLSDADKEIWASKQVYLALGNVMTVAAELEIDTCPMEGFEPEKYNELLGLADKGLNAAVALAVGYRSSEDETQHLPKVRYAKEELISYI